MALDLDLDTDTYSHPAWLAAAATGVGYLLILFALFVVLFVLPWAAFGLL